MGFKTLPGQTIAWLHEFWPPGSGDPLRAFAPAPGAGGAGLPAKLGASRGRGRSRSAEAALVGLWVLRLAPACT